MGELWRDIPEYEGLYQISNCGRVKSLARRAIGINRWGTPSNRLVPEIILSQHDLGKGYLYVHLCKKGVRKMCTVHRLMAKTFLNITPNLTVNHRDGIKTNNRLANLESMTIKDNIRHAFRIGLR